MSKNHKAGGKITGSHTTVIPFAGDIVEIIKKISIIEKISLGIINPRLKSTNHRRVKIQKEGENGGTCVLLTVRDTSSLQEIRTYSVNLQEAMLSIAKELRNKKIKIKFNK